MLLSSLIEVYETSQLGLIALHIFRVWHGTIRCNRCGSEPLLLVDCCVLCSVITVSTAFIARLSIGTAFIARLSVGTALWLVFRLGRRYGSSFGWDGVHRSSPLLFSAQRSPLVSRWRSSLISFRLDLAFIARSFSVSTWRALFARALVDVVIS